MRVGVHPRGTATEDFRDRGDMRLEEHVVPFAPVRVVWVAINW